jgi:hypothetical protein
MASKINVISNALLLIGDKTISTLNEGTARALVASNLYDSIYESELASHPWGFARTLATLSLTTQASEIDTWDNVYQLPTDFITLYRFHPIGDYEVYGDKIYTNLTNVTIDYTAKVQEAGWPGYFQAMMQYALAKDFAVSIRENTEMASYMTKMYLGAAQKARAYDSKQKIQRPIQSAPFLEVRG